MIAVIADVPRQGLKEGEGGAHGQQDGHDQAQEEEEHVGQCQVVGGQHQHVGGGQAGDALGIAGGRGGGHEVLGGGDVERLPRTLKTLLSAPKVSDSPGFVKSRRKRVPDCLVQRRISHFTILKEKVSLEVDPKILGAVPWKSESVCGIKRGMGDSMEGPRGISKRKRK